MSEKRFKTNEERIAEKVSQIEKIQERIKADTEKIKALEKEKDVLESLQIKGVIKELNLPVGEVVKLLKELKS